MSTSIYEQIGGEAAMNAAVESFYRKVLSDERVMHFFDDIDMEKQMAKQKAFLTMVTGGPNNYTGRNMRDAHAKLVTMGLNDSHVDAIIELLGQTLAELGVAGELIQQIAAVAESVRDDVLGRAKAE
ncbi:MAG: group 1 truncated hemoglobin [Myxococcales bacterium]|nr:group 1 truncated hemoglobin [Myxococcales bacterium]MCB9705411.1 group 1 truncated hemoglobin [Myxococcales bacterium]